jgi:hypothetical protein
MLLTSHLIGPFSVFSLVREIHDVLRTQDTDLLVGVTYQHSYCSFLCALIGQRIPRCPQNTGHRSSGRYYLPTFSLVLSLYSHWSKWSVILKGQRPSGRLVAPQLHSHWQLLYALIGQTTCKTWCSKDTNLLEGRCINRPFGISLSPHRSD